MPYTKLEADKLTVENLKKPELLRVLEHVDQHFWPPRPTRQAKSELVAAIWAAMRAGRYEFRVQDAHGFSESEAEAWARKQGEALAADAGTRDHDRVADPRDPRPDDEMVGRDPIFRYHNCYRCKDGTLSCVHGKRSGCEFLQARND